MGTSMKKELDKKIRSIHNRRIGIAVLALVAIVVACAVANVVKQRGSAATHAKTVLDCQFSGVAAHTHGTECYDEDGSLVCPLPELALHVHDDSCYQEERVLVCGLDGAEGHEHGEDCYQAELNRACGQEEVTQEHMHGPCCFATI